MASMTIGERLKAERLARNLTLEQAGAIAGTSKQSMSQIEKGGTKTPNGMALEAWSRYYGVHMRWLVTGKGPRSLNDPETENNSRSESSPPSHLLRVDRVRMRDAIELLGYLAELQAVNATALTSDPEAIAIAYDYLTEMDAPVEHGDILDITKRIAARIRGETDASEKRGKTS